MTEKQFQQVPSGVSIFLGHPVAPQKEKKSAIIFSSRPRTRKKWWNFRQHLQHSVTIER